MKIALVNVSDSAEAYGLINLASFLKKYGNFNDIEIININRRTGFITETNIGIEEYVKELEKLNPDVIGLSAMTFFFSRLEKLVKLLRSNENLKDKIIIIGGIHLSTLPDSMPKEADAGVIGEGEETTLELMKNFEKNKKVDYNELKNIKGIEYYKDGKLIKTERRELMDSLDKLPLPDEKWAHLNVIPETSKGKGNSTSILTSRGCPYKCIFCSTSLFWGHRVRFMSAQRVCDEIEFWHNKHNVTSIIIWDDLFSINKTRLKEIVDELKKRELLGKVKFDCMARSNTIDDEVCQLLKDLNVRALNFGFESGNERMLNFLKKESVTVEDHKNAIRLGKKYGLRVGGSLILGSPTETIEEMKDTLKFIDYCIKNKVDHIWTFVMTPFPGTEIWEMAKKSNKVSDDMDWEKLSHYAIENPLLLDDHISRKEFKKVFMKGRSKLRYFILKNWWRRFKEEPYTTTKSVLKGFRFIKFFTKDFI